jgi:hypothetical protein
MQQSDVQYRELAVVDARGMSEGLDPLLQILFSGASLIALDTEGF